MDDKTFAFRLLTETPQIQSASILLDDGLYQYVRISDDECQLYLEGDMPTNYDFGTGNEDSDVLPEA